MQENAIFAMTVYGKLRAKHLIIIGYKVNAKATACKDFIVQRIIVKKIPVVGITGIGKYSQIHGIMDARKFFSGY